MTDLLENVREVIRRRRTEKVLGDVASPLPVDPESLARHDATVRQCVRDAGWAPFHFERGVDGIAEPWRAHILWRASAQSLARYLKDDLALQSKEPQLLAGCGAAIVVNWIPETSPADDVSATTIDDARRAKSLARDREHLAAAAAMVQNLLLLLTAAGLGTYWSSGGKLSGDATSERLGIDSSEQLLAVVFVDYGDAAETTTRKPGAHRDKRSDAWIREVTV